MGYKTEKKIPSIIFSVFIVLLILVGTIVPAYAAPTQDMMVTDSGEMLSDREEQEVSEMLYSSTGRLASSIWSTPSNL